MKYNSMAFEPFSKCIFSFFTVKAAKEKVDLTQLNDKLFINNVNLPLFIMGSAKVRKLAIDAVTSFYIY